MFRLSSSSSIIYKVFWHTVLNRDGKLWKRKRYLTQLPFCNPLLELNKQITKQTMYESLGKLQWGWNMDYNTAMEVTSYHFLGLSCLGDFVPWELIPDFSTTNAAVYVISAGSDDLQIPVKPIHKHLSSYHHGRVDKSHFGRRFASVFNCSKNRQYATDYRTLSRKHAGWHFLRHIQRYLSYLTLGVPEYCWSVSDQDVKMAPLCRKYANSVKDQDCELRALLLIIVIFILT